jgi:hypothetical protein
MLYEAGYQEEDKNSFHVVVVFRANHDWEEIFG